MTTDGNPDSDDSVINGKPIEMDLDHEGCTDSGHCHRPRSLRQETTLTAEGKRRVCHRPAGWGTPSPGFGPCKLHGGRTPSVRRMVERLQAENAAQMFGLPQDVDPAQALLDEVQRTAGHVAWLGRMIQAIENPEDIVYGLVEEVLEPVIETETGNTVTRTVSGKWKAQPSVWYELYARERRHLVAASKAALDAGINERIVKVYEQIGDRYISMMEKALDAMNPTGEQRTAAWQALYRELRELSGDAQ